MGASQSGSRRIPDDRWGQSPRAHILQNQRQPSVSTPRFFRPRRLLEIVAVASIFGKAEKARRAFENAKAEMGRRHFAHVVNGVLLHKTEDRRQRLEDFGLGLPTRSVPLFAVVACSVRGTSLIRISDVARIWCVRLRYGTWFWGIAARRDASPHLVAATSRHRYAIDICDL